MSTLSKIKVPDPERAGRLPTVLELDLSDPAQFERYGRDDYFERRCLPIVVETCEWLARRLARAHL